MRNRSGIFHYAFVITQLILIHLWTSLLQDTDAYRSVYILCGICSALCLFDNAVYHSNIQSLRRPRLGRMILSLSAVFSFLVILANYSVFLRYRNVEMIGVARNIILNVFHCCMTFLGGIIVFANIILFVFCHIVEEYPRPVISSKSTLKIFWISFALFVAVFSANLFLLEYPGNLSPDSINQIRQIQTGQYLSAHPFWHSMVIKLLVSLGMALFEDMNAAVALFSMCQIIFVALSFSCVLVTMYQAGMPTWCVAAAFCAYCFQPYNIALSITMWKDVPFSIAAMLMAVGLYRSICRLGKHQWVNETIFAVGSSLLCLMRTNGILTYGISCVFIGIALWKHHKKLVAILASVLVVCGILSGPVASAVTVDDRDHLESFAIPIQQVARVIYDGCELTEEQYELLDRIIDVEKVSEEYKDWLTDPIKELIRDKDSDYFNNNLKLYGKLWLELGMEYPWEYLKAWIDQTKGYWNGGYDYFQYSESMYENEFGLEKRDDANPILVRVKYVLFGMVRFSALFEPLNSIGLHVWAMFLCMVINIYRKRMEYLMCIPSLVIIAGLILCTPVYSEFRYAYAVFLCLPLILVATILPYPIQETLSERKQNDD